MCFVGQWKDESDGDNVKGKIGVGIWYVLLV